MTSSKQGREVFEELGLSRKMIKKIDCTQTPTVELTVPGEVPDENVISVIEMLRSKEIKDGLYHLTGRRKQELKEESKEVYLSREMMDSNLCKNENLPTNTVSDGLPPGELPDEAVSSIIEMLRPRIRQSRPSKTVIVKECETKNENPKCVEGERRACNNDSMRKPSGILSGQALEISSISTLEPPIALRSNLSRGSGDEMVKRTHLALFHQNDTGKNNNSTNTEKEAACMVSNMEKFKRRRNRRRSRKKKPKQFADSSTGTTGSQCLVNSEQINTCINEEVEVNKIEKGSISLDEHGENRGKLKSDEVLLQQILVDNLTVLRNKTIWTESPFFVQVDGENSEETNCNVDSEPTQGATDMMQYKSHFNHPEQYRPNSKEYSEHFMRSLQIGEKEHQYDKEPCMFKTMNTQTDSYKNLEEGKFEGVGLSKTSLSTMTRSFSETSLSSLCNCTSYFDEKALPCYCQNIDIGRQCSSGKLREVWAITKINVYPDDSRTYEVMPLTGKKPVELPEKSDSVFVIIPPKQGPYVPCNL